MLIHAYHYYLCGITTESTLCAIIVALCGSSICAQCGEDASTHT